MSHHTATFTPDQRAALDYTHNIFLKANAGSGKTMVMVNRFISLLFDHPALHPQEILAITFTTLAASELKSRIRSTLLHNAPFNRSPAFLTRVLPHLNAAPITTIHGFCNLLLKRYAIPAGLDPHFTVLEPEEHELLLQDCIETTIDQLAERRCSNLKKLLTVFSAQYLSTLLLSMFSKQDTVQKHILAIQNGSDFSAESLQLDQFNAVTEESRATLRSLVAVFDEATTTVKQRKSEQGALDYHDLLTISQAFLSTSSDLPSIRANYRYIMVDEFQDTDPVQWEIIQQLCESPEQKKLFIVGDLKQSIYSFRGADPRLFNAASVQFFNNPHSKIIHLSDNFRTAKAIVSFLNPLFKSLFKTQDETFVPLVANRDYPEASVSFNLSDPEENSEGEIHRIAHWITNHLRQHPQYTMTDVAILTRRKQLFGRIKAILKTYNLPVCIHSDQGFYQHEEIIDMCALVKSLLFEQNTLSWIRVLQSPFFSMSDDLIYILLNAFPSHSLLENLEHISQLSTQGYKALDLSKADHTHIKTSYHHIRLWLYESKLHPLSSVLEGILSQTHFLSVYGSEKEGSEKIQRCQQFLDMIADSFDNRSMSRRALMRFLDKKVQLHSASAPTSQTNEDGAIHLMTIHAAKGLEFPIVILAECHHPFHIGQSVPLLVTQHGMALSSGSSYHRHNIRDFLLAEEKKNRIEEEKRLFYVACTRAKDHLLLSLQYHDADTRDTPEQSYWDFLRPFVSVEHAHVNVTFDTIKQQYPRVSITQKPAIFLEPPAQTSKSVRKEAPAFIPSKSKKIFNLSVSQVNSILNCSKQFYLSPMIKRLDRNPSTSQIGTLIHHGIFLLNQSPQPVSEVIKKLLPPTLITDKKTILSHLQGYTNSTLYKDIHNASHSYFETPFTLSLPRLVIEGRFDAAIQVNKYWQLIDYKSGQCSPQHIQRFTNQCKIYLLGLKHMLKLDQDHYPCTLYFTHTQQRHMITISAKELQQFQDRMSTLADYLSAHYFTKPALETCQTCPYFSLNPSCPDEPASYQS